MSETIKAEFVCVVCPTGCAIDAEYVRGMEGAPPKLLMADGFTCQRGEKWIHQEIEKPMRTISLSVLVTHGDYLCASVRTQTPIPLDKIPQVADAMRNVVLEAPVHIGQVILANPAGTETNIIATREVTRV